jgi:tetratricopeptide (TPR) repeat protein
MLERDYNLKFFYACILSLIFLGCAKKEVVETKLVTDSYNEGKYLTAITYADEVLRKDPSNYIAAITRGKSSLKLGNYSEAVKDFSNCLEQNQSFEPYYYRARAFLELNEFEKSRKDLESGLLIDPNNVEALFDLAYVGTLTEDFELAIDAYERVIQLDPANTKAYVNLGNVKGRMGESDIAIKYFSKAISINPNDAIAYFNRATEKLMLNDKKGAVEDLSFSVSIDSNNISSHFLIAETYLQLKDFKNTIKHVERIIKLDSQNARAYFLKGTAELELKENDKACTDLRKAGELGYYDAYELITKNCVKKENKKSKH